MQVQLLSPKLMFTHQTNLTHQQDAANTSKLANTVRQQKFPQVLHELTRPHAQRVNPGAALGPGCRAKPGSSEI